MGPRRARMSLPLEAPWTRMWKPVADSSFQDFPHPCPPAVWGEQEQSRKSERTETALRPEPTSQDFSLPLSQLHSFTARAKCPASLSTETCHRMDKQLFSSPLLLYKESKVENMVVLKHSALIFVDVHCLLLWTMACRGLGYHLGTVAPQMPVYLLHSAEAEAPAQLEVSQGYRRGCKRGLESRFGGPDFASWPLKSSLMCTELL